MIYNALVTLVSVTLEYLPILSAFLLFSPSLFLVDLQSLPPRLSCFPLINTCKYFLSVTRQNDKISQIKATLLSPVFPLSLGLTCLLPLS